MKAATCNKIGYFCDLSLTEVKNIILSHYSCCKYLNIISIQYYFKIIVAIRTATRSWFVTPFNKGGVVQYYIFTA